MPSKRNLTDTDMSLLKKTFVTKKELRKVVQEEVGREVRKEGQVLQETLDHNMREALDDAFTKFSDKLFTKIDPILKEVVAIRDDRTVQAAQIANVTDRVEKIESHLNIATQ